MALWHLSERLRRAAAVMGVVSLVTSQACRSRDTRPPHRVSGTPTTSSLHQELAAVEQALDGGETREAGRLLAGTLRNVEGDIASSHARLDPSSAETFEAVRRTADRWQAGVPSSSSDARVLLSSLERQAGRVLGRGDPGFGTGGEVGQIEGSAR